MYTLCTVIFSPAQNVYCDSYKCSYGYALIDNADDVECKRGKCKESQCCDKVCSSYDCPKYYELVHDAGSTVCKDYKCTKDQCCKKGEACFEARAPKHGSAYFLSAVEIIRMLVHADSNTIDNSKETAIHVNIRIRPVQWTQLGLSCRFQTWHKVADMLHVLLNL